MKPIKLTKEQTAIVEELLEVQEKKRAASRIADGHEGRFKALRDQALHIFNLPPEGPAIALALTPDGRQFKLERKLIHKKAQGARDEARLEFAFIG